MDISVVLAQEHHYPGQHAALAIVAAEKKYLATTVAPPFEQWVDFYRDLRIDDFPHYVALDGQTVVGWCDVSPVFGQSRAHVGAFGIALLPAYRHQGIGARLIASAIDHAWRADLTRIELTVRMDNPGAKRLYERFGFEMEGVKRRGSFIDGEYQDLAFMALVRP